MLRPALLSLVSAYSRLVPLEKGKSPLQQWALKAVSPIELTARARSGEQFMLRFPEDHGWEDLYFRGQFETGTTGLIAKLLDETDIVMDIGANLGWFTVQMARRVPRGECHAFEPVPHLFQRLQHNCALNGLEKNIRLTQTALGNDQGTVDIYQFTNTAAGMSSLSKHGRSDYVTFSVPLTRLNTYIDAQRMDRIDVIKMDVEGAEMDVLAAGDKPFRLQRPPIWILEMNSDTARSFGYAPQDLLRRLNEYHPHQFFRVEAGWGKTLPMKSITDFAHGDNVLCVPPQRKDRLARLGLS